LIECNNIGSFYKFVNRRISKRNDIGIITGDGGKVVTDDYEKACTFNTYFANVSAAWLAINDNNNILPSIIDTSCYSVYFRERDVQETKDLFYIWTYIIDSHPYFSRSYCYQCWGVS